MKIYVVATFSGTGEQLPSVIGHSASEHLPDDVVSVLQAFLDGGQTTLHLVMTKEKGL